MFFLCFGPSSGGFLLDHQAHIVGEAFKFLDPFDPLSPQKLILPAAFEFFRRRRWRVLAAVAFRSLCRLAFGLVALLGLLWAFVRPQVGFAPKRGKLLLMLGDVAFCQRNVAWVSLVRQNPFQVVECLAVISPLGLSLKPRFCGLLATPPRRDGGQYPPDGPRSGPQSAHRGPESLLARFGPLGPVSGLYGPFCGLYGALKLCNDASKTAFFDLKLSMFVFF